MHEMVAYGAGVQGLATPRPSADHDTELRIPVRWLKRDRSCGEGRMTLTGLTGRGTELARLRAAIDKARTGRPVTLLVRGEPGIGKSAVLEALSVLAADTGFEVAVARTRAYPDSPFAAADHLLGRLLSAGTPATPSTDRPALLEHLRHLVDLVRTHAHRSPVVLCLDDVADADPWSLRWLLALAGSAYPTQVVIALSADDFGVGHEPPGGARLTALAEHIDLTGLPAAALSDFAAARCGVALDENSASVCHELTGGNPSLVVALLSAHTGRAPTAGELRATVGSAVLPGTERWLGELSRPALALARAVAVLGTDAEIAQAADLARLTVSDTLSALDELSDRCLLANRTPPAFRHPLLAAMVIGRIPVGTRAALHLRAAEILRDGHFGATSVARQLVAAGPLGLSWTVRPLRTAARRLAQEGRADDAAQHLRGVLRDRLRPRVRSAVRRELARLDAFVDPDLTAHQLDAARQEAADPVIATDYAVALAGLLTECGRPADAVTVLDDTTVRLGTAAPEQCWRLRLHKAYICLDGPGRLVGTADPLDELIARSPQHAAARRELAGLRAADAVRTGKDRAAAVRFAGQALAENQDGPGRSWWHGCIALIRADELTEAWTHCSRIRPADGARPGHWDHVTAELLRATIHRVRGDLTRAADALAPMTELLSVAASTSRLPAALAVSVLAEARALMGDTSTALALLTGCGLDQELPLRQDTPAVLAARAVVRECTGELSRAVEDHLAVGRLLSGRRVRNPAVVPWRSRAAQLLAAAGEPAEAAHLAVAELEDARQWGTARAIGTAQHAVAMAATGPQRIGLLAAAVGTLARSPARLELAAARFDLGAALGAAGRLSEARTELTAALSTATSCGAQPLVHRIETVQQEVFPEGPDEPLHPTLRNLTPQELRILRLARNGHTNRAIAGKLFVTVRTVEFHLSGAYRKLGISGRRQLAEIIPATLTAQPGGR